MMAGCFSAADTGRLVKIKGKLNAVIYRELLENNLMLSVKELQLEEI